MSTDIKQPFPVTKPGEVAVEFAGKVHFTNDAGGRYDHCKSLLLTDRGVGDSKRLDEQLNQFAIDNPKANIVHMQPMGENALLIFYNFMLTPTEIEELDWTEQAVHEFLAKKREERAAEEEKTRVEKEQEEAATAYYTRTGKDFHETGALLKKLKQELGGAKKEELTRLFNALHDGSLFVALGVEVPEHLKPKPPPAVIALPPPEESKS